MYCNPIVSLRSKRQDLFIVHPLTFYKNELINEKHFLQYFSSDLPIVLLVHFILLIFLEKEKAKYFDTWILEQN